jgi:hypothetical protein
MQKPIESSTKVSLLLFAKEIEIQTCIENFFEMDRKVCDRAKVNIRSAKLINFGLRIKSKKAENHSSDLTDQSQSVGLVDSHD